MPELPIRSTLVILYVLRPTAEGHEVLLLKRTTTLAGEWCQISGRIEGEEKAWATALRELREETGLEAEALYLTDFCQTYYGQTLENVNIAPVFVAYVASDAAVELNFEHSDFKWASFDEAADMVPYGGQRQALKFIEDEYSKRQPTKYLAVDLSRA